MLIYFPDVASRALGLSRSEFQNGVVDQDKVYQRIGEFVVSFQFIENQLRQIGWLLLDPGGKA